MCYKVLEMTGNVNASSLNYLWMPKFEVQNFCFKNVMCISYF